MQKYMLEAILQARKAGRIGEVPVGAVIVKDDKIIARAYNTREKTQNALCHAEILAIQKACKNLHTFRLSDCQMYVTLEPCAMCTGAIINARIGQVFVGCKDENFGCCGGKVELTNGDFGFSPKITFGVMEKECKALIDSFFCSAREKGKLKKLLGKEVEIKFNGNYFTKVGDKEIPCFFERQEDEPFRKNGEKPLKERVVTIIDDLKKGKIFFLCGENFNVNFAKDVISELKLRGQIKIFIFGRETLIFDAKKLTKGEEKFNI